jgi:hypothetical protein
MNESVNVMQRLDRLESLDQMRQLPAKGSAHAIHGHIIASWPAREWRERAAEMIDSQISAHLTLVDDEGFPLPFRTRSARLVRDGFDLEVAAGAPWKTGGMASLCFAEMATFIGDVVPADVGAHFRVERIMPDLPMVQDPQGDLDTQPRNAHRAHATTGRGNGPAWSADSTHRRRAPFTNPGLNSTGRADGKDDGRNVVEVEINLIAALQSAPRSGSGFPAC